MIADYRAAWVPWPAAHPSPEHIAQLAAEHWLDDARRNGITPLIIADSRRDVSSGTPLESLAATYETVTPRGNPPTGSPRAVLAWVPNHKSMHLAMGAARGGSLTVVEYPTTPLLGWALEVGAINLLTGVRTPDSRSEQVRQYLDHLHLAGNNGWADAPGERDAKRILKNLRDTHSLDLDLITGSMLARGMSAAALQRLRRFAPK